MAGARGRGWTWLLVVGLGACAADDEPADSTSTSGESSTGAPAETSSDGSDSSTGSADESSTGEPSPPPPDPCATAEIAQGIVGRTDLRVCDVEGDCVDPEPGVPVWLFDDNPQIGGGDLDPGMLDPAIPMLEATASGAGGLFEFAVGAGSYFVCTPEGADMVLCSPEVIIVGADPLWAAFYETGNGSSWSTRSCAE